MRAEATPISIFGPRQGRGRACSQAREGRGDNVRMCWRTRETAAGAASEHRSVQSEEISVDFMARRPSVQAQMLILIATQQLRRTTAAYTQHSSSP